jgi:hypothetical protein
MIRSQLLAHTPIDTSTKPCQPTASHIWRLIDHHRAAIALAASSLYSNLSATIAPPIVQGERYTGGAAPANTFQLLALTRVHRYPGTQRESSDPDKLISALVILFPGRNRLQGEHFAPRMKSHGHPVPDRVAL